MIESFRWEVEDACAGDRRAESVRSEVMAGRVKGRQAQSLRQEQPGKRSKGEWVAEDKLEPVWGSGVLRPEGLVKTLTCSGGVLG